MTRWSSSRAEATQLKADPTLGPPVFSERFTYLLVAGLACISVLGCDSAFGGDEFIRHPIRDSLSVDPAEAVRVRRDATEAASLNAFKDRLEHRTVTASIGVLDGDPEYEFGRVVDAHLLRDGSLAILDQQAKIVRVFGRDGSYRYSIGGPGDGPGELNVPAALLAPNPRELWIVDQGRTIHRFEEVDGRLVFTDRITLESFPRDGCVSGRSIVIHMRSHLPGISFGKILYRFDSNGALRGQFAVPYRSSVRLVAGRMNRGFVTCTDSDMVLLAFESQNRLDAYRVSDGQLLWHAFFEDVHVPILREEKLSDGRTAVSADIRSAPTSHWLLSVAGGHGTPIVVQFARRTREDLLNRVDRYVIETFLVDPKTGNGTYIGEDIPQILTVTDDQAVLLYSDPAPRIEVAQLGPD